LGPGLLESIYEKILLHELQKSGLKYKWQVNFPIIHDGRIFDMAYRIDIIVENKVIVELKSVEVVLPVHKKQLLTYLKISGIKVGLMINYNES